MSFTADAAEQVLFDNQIALSATHTLSGTEKLVGDESIAGGTTDGVVNVGIPSTTKLKYIAFHNKGTVDLTFKIDAGVAVVSLKAGETLVLAGEGVAKAIIDLIAGAATCLLLKVTVGAGPDPALLEYAALIDAT